MKLVPLIEPNPAWSPSPQYAKVAGANRQFYSKNAQACDQTETCLKDPAAQQYLDRTLDEVLSRFDGPASKLRVLDACGGIGDKTDSSCCCASRRYHPAMLLMHTGTRRLGSHSIGCPWLLRIK